MTTPSRTTPMNGLASCHSLFCGSDESCFFAILNCVRAAHVPAVERDLVEPEGESIERSRHACARARSRDRRAVDAQAERDGRRAHRDHLGIGHQRTLPQGVNATRRLRIGAAAAEIDTLRVGQIERALRLEVAVERAARARRGDAEASDLPWNEVGLVLGAVGAECGVFERRALAGAWLRSGGAREGEARAEEADQSERSDDGTHGAVSSKTAATWPFDWPGGCSERVRRLEMSWNESSTEGELVRELSRCLDACRASELYCTMAMDVASVTDDAGYGKHSADVLRACATLCSITASSIASLRTPDLDTVADALLTCRVACRAAGSECRRRPFDACCTECAAVCGECAKLCESLLSRTSLAAA